VDEDVFSKSIEEKLLLAVKDLHVSYRGIRALRGISLTVEEEQIVTLLGANGAGKSTTIRAISGMVPIDSGEVLFQGDPIDKLPVHRIQKLGLVHIPEGRKIFANLTVRENLIMGAYHNRDREDLNRAMQRIFSTFPILESRIDQLGGTLSGGEQQMLAVGRALMSKPTLLMMDEPSLGLAPLFVTEVFRIIEEIREEGVTVFLVEQNANAALKVADHAYVLENGRIVLQGSGEKLLANQRVREYYLGETSGRDPSGDV
jgi:branched-chain amino acid transport system ATP-binding protein